MFRQACGKDVGLTLFTVDILDSYIQKAPSSQNVVDLFENEWSSRFPADIGVSTKPAHAGLFEDERIKWTEGVLGGFDGKSVLELGPLEAGHSYMLQKGGAAKVTAIEANSRAFLKCLCVKELLGLDRVNFLLGDFMAFLEDTEEKWDIAVASGVLYHMQDPIGLIERLSKVADKLMLWTHYYDEAIIVESSHFNYKFHPQDEFEYDGVSYQFAVQEYKQALDWAGFSGGSKPTTRWLTRESLFRALDNFGYVNSEISFDDPSHSNGPSIAICAWK